jgi:hypothetical protein
MNHVKNIFGNDDQTHREQQGTQGNLGQLYSVSWGQISETILLIRPGFWNYHEKKKGTISRNLMLVCGFDEYYQRQNSRFLYSK